MSLESLKRESYLKKSKLNEEAARLKAYQKKVDELDSLYEKMKKKKEKMKDLKKSLDKFSDETYEYWKGNIFNNKYKKVAKSDLVKSDYQKTIDIIDNNLDAINNKRKDYQNLIYKSNGIIGNLQAGINSLATRIENWFN